jgi:hypothetical protein
MRNIFEGVRQTHTLHSASLHNGAKIACISPDAECALYGYLRNVDPMASNVVGSDN